MVLALAWWLLRAPEDEQDTADETLIEREPDLYANAVTLQQYRPDGSLHYTLDAESIRQYDAEALTRMRAPVLYLTNPTQPPWTVSANHGYLRKGESDEDVVYLREDVEMEQQRTAQSALKIRSSLFYIYPGRQYAETDQDVMIDSEVGRTTAAGMSANLADGILLLTSANDRRVHTIVLPEQFKAR